jgi:hypothetical protein
VGLAPAVRREQLRRRRLAAVGGGGRAAADAGWAEIVAESTDRGVPAGTSDTVRATARRLVREHHLDASAQEHLRRVVGAVEASFYGGTDPAPGELDGPVRAVRDAVAAGSPTGVRERLLPRSVLHGEALRRLTRRGAADQGRRDETAGVG